MGKAITEREFFGDTYPEWELPQLPGDSTWRLGLFYEKNIFDCRSFFESSPEGYGQEVYTGVLSAIEAFGLPNIGDVFEFSLENCKVKGKYFDGSKKVVSISLT